MLALPLPARCGSIASASPPGAGRHRHHSGRLKATVSGDPEALGRDDVKVEFFDGTLKLRAR